MDVDQPNALAEQIGLRGEDLERVLRRNAERLFRIT
jgi:predicted TIM-barrel fold metal-dependent hydrolase